jgi:hypothetical protein
MRPRLSYSNVASTIALILALGTGGAWAVDQINGNRLVDRSVGGRKLKNDTVRGAKVDESTLRGLVKGNGRAVSGHAVQAEHNPLVPARTLETSVGRFTIGCGTGADTRYRNTTPGAAEVYRTVGVVGGLEVGEEDDATDRDFVTKPGGADIGYSATEATGPRVVELRVGKGRRGAVFTAAAANFGDSCSWTWQLVSSG